MTTRTSGDGRGRALKALLIAAVLLLAVVPGAAAQPGEQEQAESGAGATTVTQNNDLLLDDTGTNDSRLILRDPGTSNDWELQGGVNSDFRLIDPSLNRRLEIEWNDVFSADRDTILRAFGSDGDVILQATSQSLVLGPEGAGVNVASPARPFEVVGDPGGAQAVVKARSSATSDLLRTVFSIENVGPPSFTLIDSSPGGADWFFRSSQSGAFAISTNDTPVVEMTIKPGGNVSIAGSLTQGSSRSVKHDVAAVDTAAVLDAVRSLDISTWAYDSQPGVVHMGPMAEDFAAAFGLGATTTGIAAVDADGVALAAIQALAASNAELESENRELAKRNGALEAEVAGLDARLATIEATFASD